jgi:hypothetical protein
MVQLHCSAKPGEYASSHNAQLNESLFMKRDLADCLRRCSQGSVLDLDGDLHEGQRGAAQGFVFAED